MMMNTKTMKTKKKKSDTGRDAAEAGHDVSSAMGLVRAQLERG